MHFGEIALINNVKRTLSVRALEPCKLLSLTRASFNRILGSIKQFLKEDYQNERTQIMDGSFISDQNGQNSSALSQNLYGINEEVDKEDDVNLNAKEIQKKSISIKK